MALHNADARVKVSPFGTVMGEGYSLELGKDQVGIFSKSSRKVTAKGLKSLVNFDGIDKAGEKLAVLFGSNLDSLSDKSTRTIDFTLRDVKRVGISKPKQAEQKVDYWRVGWDGVNDNTSLTFKKGQVVEFSFTAQGPAITFFNDSDEYEFRTTLSIPNLEPGEICNECQEVDSPCEPVDCRVHTLRLVKQLNDIRLPCGELASELFDIYPIFDTPNNPTAPNVVKYKQWSLEYCGFGGDHELSAVSAQYPGYKVTRDTLSGRFLLIAPEAYTPAAFNKTNADVIKGCAACPAGYTAVEGGHVYAVSISDEGNDVSATKIGTLPNAVAGTAFLNGRDGAFGHYTVVLSKPLSADDEKTFVTANKTAQVLYAGTVGAFCKNNAAATTHQWKLDGEFTATKQKYRIIVPNDCQGARLAEIQAAYPELTITQVSNQNCVSVFETSVVTNFSNFKGCNDAIIQQVFDSKAPVRFGVNNFWYIHEDAAAAGTTKCGFEIKAKPFIINPSECVIDKLPFIATSTRITNLAGGYPLDYSLHSLQPKKGLWAVLQLERAIDLDNLGGNMRAWEKNGNMYFHNEKPFNDVITRAMTGTQTKLEGLTQYSEVFLEVEREKTSGILEKSYDMIRYRIMVPYGRTTELEAKFRLLAGAAGVPFEVL